MPQHAIIVVGASTGGVEALQQLVGGMPAGLPAALCIVWHLAADSPGLLPKVLERAGPLPAANAEDGEPILPGRIYVAPPDRHLLLVDGKIRLTRGPKENLFRPSIDPLFRSAAAAYGPHVIGVILSGALDDGTAGLWAVKQQGGWAMVQDPSDALAPSMPRSAMRHVAVDHVAPAAELGPLLADLVGRGMIERGATEVSDELRIEAQIAMEDTALAAGVMRLGDPTPYTCPECHGTLMQLASGGIPRFRCHTGHAFSVDSLLAAVGGSIEAQLWSSIRAIEEQVLLLRHLADHLGKDDAGDESERLRSEAREAEQQAHIVRLAVMRRLERAPAAAGVES